MNKLVAIIPARGGSKSIPKKNIYFLAGKPLLVYTIEAVLESKVTNYVFVSTEDEEIATLSLKYGVEVIRRPLQFAKDSSPMEDVLIHAVQTIKKQKGFIPDLILTLQPTSPLRKSQTIKQFVAEFLKISDVYDAMLSLTESYADYWIKNEDGEFRRLFPEAPRRRQDRKPIYIENSALYITKTVSLLKTRSILGEKTAGFIIDPIEAVDINDFLDLKWAEFLLNRLKKEEVQEWKK